MKTILLMEQLSITPLLWLLSIFVVGVVAYIIKTAPELDENGYPVKDNSIHHNIQSMNRMGYHPEEDDEITGYEYAEKPHIDKS